MKLFTVSSVTILSVIVGKLGAAEEVVTYQQGTWMQGAVRIIKTTEELSDMSREIAPPQMYTEPNNIFSLALAALGKIKQA